MIRRAGLAAGLAFGLSGCLGFSVGGGHDIERAITPHPVGKELESLHAAQQEGYLDEYEYEQLKRELLTNGRRF